MATASWPDDPFLQGNFAPWPDEEENPALRVRGEVPRELNGTYYRNGPNPQFPPPGRYHWFDGDGMIHAFAFNDGSVTHRNRWVRTERFEREREAGRGLFGGLADMAATDPSVAAVSANAANTNIIWHAGRLLALWEGGLPTELDPKTLETLGKYDYDGKLVRPGGGLPGEPAIMTAHPKIDPDTGELLFFGYNAVPPYLVYYVADADGKITRMEEIDVPFPTMMHDFITTEEHVIFPVFPVPFDLQALATGGPPLSWQPEKGTHIGIMPRDGGSTDVVWVEGDPQYVFHPMNAHTDGRTVVAEVSRHERLALFEMGEGLVRPTLTRWTIDLDSRSMREEKLDDVAMEFSRLDERFAGKAYRHGYAVGAEEEATGDATPTFNAVFHWDHATGKRQSHLLGPQDACGEAIFVPRSKDSPEGQGFVVVLVYRGELDRNELLVLDAENVGGEPLAAIETPHRIPHGFHGNWRPA